MTGNDAILNQNKSSWDAMADTWFGTTALPVYGCSIPTEAELNLFPDLSGKNVLDLGCGSGHSLRWCHERGAAGLWGVDLSGKQIENARKYLAEAGIEATLRNAPMEAGCGLPRAHFDVVFSIYAIGWTTDLKATIQNVAACLKPGGVFIFSWDHPFLRHVEAIDGRLVVTRPYTADGPISYIQRGQPVTVHNYRLSTYINELAAAGFIVERLVEETDSKTLSGPAGYSEGYYAGWRAKQLPLSFIIKARKA